MIELKKPSVTVDRTKYPGGEILAIDPEWDVALLKIDAAGIVPVVYAPTSAVPQGTWVVANGATTRTKRRVLTGIVSAKIREIPAAGGAALGVVLKANSKALEIDEVNEKSGAQRGRPAKRRLIVAIGGKAAQNIEDIADALKDHRAGSQSKSPAPRQGEAHRRSPPRRQERAVHRQMNRNDQMSGDFSRRRSGFPRVLQHDILGSSRITGGPLLDLDGRCLGMNIARANRAESFAIPVEDLKEIASRLMAQAAGRPE